MSSSAIPAIKEGMRAATTEGTAKSIRVGDATLYAKTGTAIPSENSERRISWICAWPESTQRDYMVLVMVDCDDDHTNVKFNIAKTILSDLVAPQE